MRYRLLLPLAGLLAVSAVGTTAALAAGGEDVGKKGREAEGVIDPKADATLKRMSTYLANLPSFSVKTDSVLEKVTPRGQKIQELRESAVMVQRPDHLRVERQSPAGRAILRYDGKQFSLSLPQKNEYAMAEAPPHLDQAVDALRDRLHIDAPAADLLLSRPYDALIGGLKTGRYIGLEPLHGKMAHHIAVTEDKVDWELWVQDGPQPVPLRYVVVTKDLPGRPQFAVDLHDWQPGASFAPGAFAFSPPAGAERIDLKQRLREKAGSRKEGSR